MFKVKVVHNTFLKRKNKPSQELYKEDLVYLPKGSEFEATSIIPDRNQHARFILASPLNKMTEVYGYIPHLEYKNNEIKLKVPYFKQLDNDTHLFGPGYRQCNTTSNCMLADFLLKGELTRRAKSEKLREPESLYMRYVYKYGDTTDHNAQTRALLELGIESYMSYTLSEEEVTLSLVKNVPVVAGFKYKSSGHICVIVGKTARNDWYVHDPYGVRYGASDMYDTSLSGEYDLYTQDLMEQIYWDQGKEAGWGRIVTAVKGVPTGLSKYW